MLLLVLLFFVLLHKFTLAHDSGLRFNNTNFYLNTTCILHKPIGTITTVTSDSNVSYQLFASQDFSVDKHRGDIIMVKKPKDPFPLFYISALDRNGTSATAVVEVSHTCPTVSFDAVSYHFFALRRAPRSIIGNLKATGGDNIKYYTESETFHVDETSGSISAKRVLPIDATSIFYVKATDVDGNMDVAEVVVEVIGCYMDVDIRHERRYNVVFEKRCYTFSVSNCEPTAITGIMTGTVKAKGHPEPTYEVIDTLFDVDRHDGTVAIGAMLEPGIVYQIHILASNGKDPDNTDVTLVMIDTKQCPATTTFATTTTNTPISATTAAVVYENALPESATSSEVTNILDTMNKTLSMDVFAIFNGTMEDDPGARDFNGTMTLEDAFLAAAGNVSDEIPPGAGLTLAPPGDSVTASTNVFGYFHNTTTTFYPATRSGVFVIHFSGRNRSKTVRPVHAQNGISGRILVKSAKPKSYAEEIHGMEIVS